MTISIERAKYRKAIDAFLLLPRERDLRILVRSVTFQPVGVITKREYLEDSSIGRARDWAVGVGTNKEIFREPLDMISQHTHELKSCIIKDNGFFVVTSRVSDDPGDDDENFQWYASPDEMNTWHELNENIKMKDGMLNSQKDKIEKLTAEKNSYYNETVRLGSDNRNMIAQTQRLSEEVSNLNTKLFLMESQVVKTAELKTELAAQLMESFKTAAERGKIKAMSTEDIVDAAIDKQGERDRKMMGLTTQLAASETTNGSTLTTNMLSDMNDRLKKVEQRDMPTETKAGVEEP